MLKDPEFRKAFKEYEKKAAVAVAIAKERIRRGLSKAELARRAGISRYMYNRMEDLDPVSPEVIDKVKAALRMKKTLR